MRSTPRHVGAGLVIQQQQDGSWKRKARIQNIDATKATKYSAAGEVSNSVVLKHEIFGSVRASCKGLFLFGLTRLVDKNEEAPSQYYISLLKNELLSTLS